MVALGRPQGPSLQRDFLTASLAWALPVRPFGAHFKDACKMQEYY
jgi:hypothetical protein